MTINKIIYIHFYTSTSSYSTYKYLKTSLSKQVFFLNRTVFHSLILTPKLDSWQKLTKFKKALVQHSG
jgi:hypothetical protein